MVFALDLYVGAFPVKFAMKAAEIADLLGPPLSVFPGAFVDQYVEKRLNVMFGYSKSDDCLFELVFAPGAALEYQGKMLFEEGDPIEFLCQFDDSPFEWVGLIIFLEIGVYVSGFHDNDEAQKAIGIFQKGCYDAYIDDFVPFLRRSGGSTI